MVRSQSEQYHTTGMLKQDNRFITRCREASMTIRVTCGIIDDNDEADILIYVET